MLARQMRELWRIRFLMILRLEKESIEFYKDFLSKNHSLLESTKTYEDLKRILEDEAKHVAIAYELLHILEGKRIPRKGRHHPEIADSTSLDLEESSTLCERRGLG